MTTRLPEQSRTYRGRINLNAAVETYTKQWEVNGVLE